MTSCSDIFQFIYDFNESLLDDILPIDKNFLIGFLFFIEVPFLLLAGTAFIAYRVWDFISNVFCANHKEEVPRSDEHVSFNKPQNDAPPFPEVNSFFSNPVLTDTSAKNELPPFALPYFK